VHELLQDRPEMRTTTALTQFIIGNAVSLAERCVADTAKSDTNTAAAKRCKKKSKKSHGIVEKFLSQVSSGALLIHTQTLNHLNVLVLFGMFQI